MKYRSPTREVTSKHSSQELVLKWGRCQTWGWLFAATFVVNIVSIPWQSGLVNAQRKTHALIDSHQAPGAIGRNLLVNGALPPATFQPVRIFTPVEATVSTSVGNVFQQEVYQPMLGLLVGRAYRFKVAYRTDFEEHVVYPTVELIDRLDPPQGMELDFPVPIEFTAEDIRLAAAGNLVTRAVYVEDPDAAMPELYEHEHGMPYFEARPGTDPMRVANTMGRTIAIVRIGSRTPDPHGATPEFMFHSPELQRLDSQILEPVAERPTESRIESWADRKRTSQSPMMHGDYRQVQNAGYTQSKRSRQSKLPRLPKPFMQATKKLFKN